MTLFDIIFSRKVSLRAEPRINFHRGEARSCVERAANGNLAKAGLPRRQKTEAAPRNDVKRLLLLAVAAALVFAIGCTPRAALKTPQAALTDRVIAVSDEEFEGYREMAKSGKDSEERSRGAFWAGQFNFNKKDYESASKFFLYNEKYYKDTLWGYLSVVRLVDILIQQKEMKKALERIKILAERRLQFPGYESAPSSRIDEITAASTPQELEAYYNLHLHRMIDEQLLYYMCRKNLEENNLEVFFRLANQFLTDFADSKYYREIEDRFKTAVKYKPVNNKKIAIITPISGEAMAIGAAINRGVKLALDEYNEGKADADKIGLIYIDEAKDEKAVLQAVIGAIEQDSVIALLGPLYSNTALKVMQVAERYNIALFSSTAAQPDLAGKSSYFFRNCGTAKGQAYAIARFVAEDTNLKKMATLFSDNAYGRTLNQYFSEKFKSLGGVVEFEMSYDPKKSDFKDEIVLLGGINNALVKEARSKEKAALDDSMKSAGRQVIEKVYNYINVNMSGAAGAPGTANAQLVTYVASNLPKTNIALLKFGSIGRQADRFNIADEMTKQASYEMARDKNVNVFKQAATDAAMDEVGVAPEDLDREVALNVAHKLNADILVWGRVVEEESNTIYAKFKPRSTIDAKGNTKVVYEITDEDYFYFKVAVYAMSVADETVISEQHFEYKKLKDPMPNPLGIEALYIPASDNKMILIKDQLKFYDLNLAVFGTSALYSNYIMNFGESVAGTIYPVDFYPDAEDSAVKEFVQKFRDTYAMTPDAISANSYDMMKMTCSVMATGVNSREAFKEGLKAIRNYNGATGVFNFGFDNDAEKEYRIMQIDEKGLRVLTKIKGE